MSNEYTWTTLAKDINLVILYYFSMYLLYILIGYIVRQSGIIIINDHVVCQS